MKNYVTIIVILLVVIVAHIFFISPLISSKQELKPEEKPQTIMKSIEPVRETYKIASKNPHFGKFFDYQNAVFGNKLSVKGCKQTHSGILVDLDTHKVLALSGQ